MDICKNCVIYVDEAKCSIEIFKFQSENERIDNMLTTKIKSSNTNNDDSKAREIKLVINDDGDITKTEFVKETIDEKKNKEEKKNEK